MVASRRRGGTRWRSCSTGSPGWMSARDGDGVPAHAGPERPAARGDAHVQDDDWVVAHDAGLAGRGWGEHCGDGVDVGVLEGAVLLSRRSHGCVVVERGAHEGRAGPEE